MLEIGYSITKNNLYIYLQRIPSAYFLIALSQSLGVSSDYLLGLENENYFSDGFDYQYDKKRYKKYIGEYFFYFYPTVSNSPHKLNVARMRIEQGSPYKVFLSIKTEEGDEKSYQGELTLSGDYSVGYIELKGNRIGEMVFMSFCDPPINGSIVKIQAILGSMLSVSSGDFKRVPVVSRFFLSKEAVEEKNKCFIESQLLLNNKYINITKTNLEKAISSLEINRSTCEKMLLRLTSAFSNQSFYSIEESYVLNTLKNDFDLTNGQVEDIISALRLKSINNANIKINKSLDARIFSYISKPIP